VNHSADKLAPRWASFHVSFGEPLFRLVCHIPLDLKTDGAGTNCKSGTTRLTNICAYADCLLTSDCTANVTLQGVDRLRKLRSLLISPSVIFSVALLIRLTYLLQSLHDQPVPTGNRYVIGYETGSIAASLAKGDGYSSPLYVPSGPTAWITPAYPILLAAVFKIFGVYTLAASVAIRCIDAIFSGLTCFPLFYLGNRLFGKTVGITASWLWAILPAAIFFSIIWVWDTSLSALLLITCLWACYALDERNEPRTWAGFGTLWGLAILVNAAILSVLPGCLLFALSRARHRGANYLKLGSLALAFVAVAVSPWVIRNLIVFHGQVTVRSNFGLELWLGNNPDVPISSSPWLHPNDAPKEKQEFLRVGEVAYMREKKLQAFHFIATHPADTLRFQYHRVLLTWTGFEDSLADVWPLAKPLLRAELALNYLLPLLMLCGLLLAQRNSPALSLPLLNVIVFFPAIYYICHTNARYRHPIDTVIILLSAYSMVWFARTIRAPIIGWRGLRDRPRAALRHERGEIANRSATARVSSRSAERIGR
jgi:hypothetical protein